LARAKGSKNRQKATNKKLKAKLKAAMALLKAYRL
jgi:hypothetical protein